MLESLESLASRHASATTDPAVAARALTIASQMASELHDLPTFPQVAQRLIQVASDDSRSLQDVAHIIEHDQALGAKVLRVANSAMFGARRQIRTVQHAAVMLGMNNVRKYALTVSVFGVQAAGESEAAQQARRRSWVHAMAVAVLARLIAAELGVGGVEEAAVAGLVHDIGKVVFDIVRPGEYDRVIELMHKEQLDLRSAERLVFGTDHSILGGELAQRWGLHSDLVAALEHHHEVQCVKSAAPGKLSPLHLVHLANFLCHQIGLTSHAGQTPDIVDVAGWSRVGVSVPDLASLLGSVQGEIERSLDYFELGPVSLVDYCDAEEPGGTPLAANDLAGDEVQHRLRQRIADLLLVTDGILTVRAEATVREVLDHVASGPLRRLGFARTVIYASDPENSQLLRLRAVHGAVARSESLPTIALSDLDDPLVATLHAGRTARLRSRADWDAGQSPLLDALQPGSCGVAPLRMVGQVVGFVLADNRAAGAPVTDSDLHVLDAVAKQVSLLLDRAAAYERLASRTEVLEDLAFRDPLTGLYNFRYLEESLEMEIRRAERYGGAFSILMLDIDHFKRLNDSYGHQAGDKALQRFAETVKSALRDSDLLFRYGGEEFTVLLPDTRKSRAVIPAENVRRAVESADMEAVAPGAGLRVTCSIGVASYPDDARTRASLIGFADDALYRAKHGGRNRVVVAVRRD